MQEPSLTEKIIVVVLVVLFVIWQFRRLLKARRKEIRRLNPSGRRDRGNYNLDVRRFVNQRLRSPKWLAWFIGGTAVACIPLLFSLETYPYAIGLAFCWWAVMIAFSGVTMNRVPPSATFMQKYQLRVANVKEFIPRIRRVISSTTFFSGTFAPNFYNILTKSTDNTKVWLFNYEFEFSDSGSKSLAQLYQYTVLMIETTTSLPEFIIDDSLEGGAVYDFDRLVPRDKLEKITLEGSFGKRFKLYVPLARDSEKRLMAMSVMTPDTMALYEEYFAGCCLIVEKGIVAVITEKNLFEDTSYQTFYQGMDTFISKIDRQAAIRSKVGMLQKP